MRIENITMTVSPKCYCKYEHTMCEFANDFGYCMKTGCSKRTTINEIPIVNKDLVEVVRCKDCKLFQPFKGVRAKVNTDKSGWCGINDYSVRADDYCSYGERREK